MAPRLVVFWQPSRPPALFVVAGRGAPPSSRSTSRTGSIGQAGTLDVTAGAPGATLDGADDHARAERQALPAVRARPAPQASDAVTRRPTPTTCASRARSASRACPSCSPAPARIVVTATPPVVPRPADAVRARRRKDFQVRLEPPRLAVAVDASLRQSRRHPRWSSTAPRRPTSLSGVRVGDVEYPGYPGRRRRHGGRRRVDSRSRSSRCCTIRTLDDADRRLRARRGRQRGDGRVRRQGVPEAVQASRIEIDDRFIKRVVPEILAHSPELSMPAPAGQTWCRRSSRSTASCARMNAAADRGADRRRRRRRGCGRDRSSSSATRRSRPSFADHRTYLYKGKEVDQQVHLGFDLAVTARVPVAAANDGTVLHAELAGHLRQLRHHRPRHGRAVALRPPVVVRRQGRRHGRRAARRSAGAA